MRKKFKEKIIFQKQEISRNIWKMKYFFLYLRVKLKKLIYESRFYFGKYAASLGDAVYASAVSS